MSTAALMAMGGLTEIWPAPNAVMQSGTLSFTGHSTFGDFVGTTTAVSGALIGNSELTNAHGWVEAAVSTLNTGNVHRDRDLRSTMDVAQYPTMRFELAGVTVASPAVSDTVKSALRGALTIHGVTHDVAIPATLIAAADIIDVSGAFPLDLADYEIDGLTRLFGVLRMKRNIEVRFHLRFRATPRASLRTLSPEKVVRHDISDEIGFRLESHLL
ncbi:MAG: YceI family protein [Gemmatimonadaceae bacterium]